MSEISVNIKCEACNGNFDEQKKIPMFLSCGHQMCYECIQNYFLSASQIQCVKDGCKEITQVHPSKIKADEDLLQSIKQASLQNDLNTLQNLEKNLSQETQKITKIKLRIGIQFMNDLESYLLASSSNVQKDLQDMLILTKKKISALMDIQGQLKSQSLQSDLARQEQKQFIENSESILQKAQQEQSKLAGFNLNIFQQNIFFKSKLQKCQRQIEKYQDLIKEQVSQQQVLQIQLLKSQNKVISERDQLKQQNIQYQQDQEKQSSSYQKQVQNLQQQLSSLESQIKNLKNENKNLTTHLSQMQSAKVQQQQSQTQTQGSQQPKQQKPQQQLQQPQQSQQLKQQQSQSQDISIIIVSPNNRTLELWAQKDTTIDQIKEQIEQQIGLFPPYLDLLKNNQILDNEQTLAQIKIVNGNSIKMRLSKFYFKLIYFAGRKCF